MDRADATADLAAARVALRDPAARRALRREIARLLPVGWSLGACRLRRVKWKPDRKLSAELVVAPIDAGGDATSPRAVTVTWEPVGRMAPVDAGAVAAVEGEAARRGVGAPFGALHVELASAGIRIRVSPFDEAFPSLVRLSDPEHVGAIIGGTDGSATAISTVRFRPGQRHVLRYGRGSTGDGSPTMFAKVYRDGAERARAYAIAGAVAARLDDDPRPFAAVRPCAHLPDDGAVVWEGVLGRPLSFRPRRAGIGADLGRAGRLLRALHRVRSDDLGVPLPRHDLDVELQATRRACEHIAHALPRAWRRIGSVLERAAELDATLPSLEPTFVHADFKLDHLWKRGEAITVMDLDSARAGEPSIDLGKLLADLRWWATTRAATSMSGVGPSTFLESYRDGDGRRPPDWRELLERSRVWEAVWLVKIAARRIPVLDPAWASRVLRTVAEAERVLGSVETGAGRSRADLGAASTA